MKIKNNKQKGFIALITVLIIGLLLLGIIMSIPLITTDNIKSTLALKKGVQARELAKSCAEITFLELQKDINYTGETLSLDSGSCIISVADSTDGKSISIEATAEDYTKTLLIEVEILGRSINIASWDIS